ncbi:MAG: NTP transferase domain-containing protein [Gaiellales bacterium]|nr:NTP transferase domain-containing protein [Gaiellales bacterium]
MSTPAVRGSRLAVVLAGGRGTRLAPYTVVMPKPLMPLGDMPILELVLRQLRRYGFRQVVLAVGHLSQLIEAYFGDGSSLGVELVYAREREPLGTAGPLALISGLDRDFLVMNGDVLTSLDLGAFLDAHSVAGAPASIATYERTNQVDFGVVQSNEAGYVTGYAEKPVHRYLVSMGVYAFSPDVLTFITPGERLDFPDLVLRLLAAGSRVRSVPFSGYWLDIGRHDDLARAQEELEAHRADFLGEDA